MLGTPMAEWWTAASWRLWLVVVVDVLFMLMVEVPLHCAAAQLVARASGFLDGLSGVLLVMCRFLIFLSLLAAGGG